MWTCERIREELPEYARLRGRMDPIAVRAVELHLESCDFCHSELESIERVFSIAGGLSAPEARPRFSLELASIAVPRFEIQKGLSEVGRFLALPFWAVRRQERRLRVGAGALVASLLIHALLWGLLGAGVWNSLDPPRARSARRGVAGEGFQPFVEAAPSLIVSSSTFDATQGMPLASIEVPPHTGPESWWVASDEEPTLSGRIWHDGPQERETFRRALGNENLRKLTRVRRLARQESERRQAQLVSSGLNPTLVGIIDSSLRWLAGRQAPSGRWQAPLGYRQLDLGVTSLALMAFLGEGHTESSGAYAEEVRRAVEFLVDSQAAPGTDRAGLFVGTLSHEGATPLDSAALYNHCLATLALLKHYELTGQHRLVIRRALHVLVDVQTAKGGWRFPYRALADDSSITCWALRALNTARELGLTAGLPGVDRSIRAGFTRLRQFTDVDGAVGYRRLPMNRGELPMTIIASAAQLQSRHSEMSGANESLLAAQTELLKSHPPTRSWRTTGTELGSSPSSSFETRLAPDLFYLYFGTLHFRELGGTAWTDWSSALHRALFDRSLQHLPETGRCEYWDRYFASGGYVYSTALRVLIVQAYEGEPTAVDWGLLSGTGQ
ncbi:MAG: hypothetical protein RL885_12490 [Planctomycetota bacterium]